MKPYSVDVRERVLAAIDGGMARTDAVQVFQVSLGSIKRWVHMRHTSGDLTPKRPTGRRATIRPDQHAAVRVQLESMPDATLDAHTAQWQADHGIHLSRWTLRRAFHRVGWSRTKRP